MADKEPTNKEMIEELQSLGVSDINPNATKAVLKEMLDKARGEKKTDDEGTPPDPGQEPEGPRAKTDTDKILEAVGGLAKAVEAVNKRIDRIEDGGKNEFKMSVKQSDIDSAAESKAKQDPRIVTIVEETLGVDFGVEVKPNPNSPGFMFTVLVPERLSPIQKSTRPIVDPETQQYKKDPKTDLVVEEVYWPGDRRSRAIGSTDSFDLIREHCNKVRAHIVTYYEKLKKPLPEFKLK